jgi:hypothetical protein
MGHLMQLDELYVAHKPEATGRQVGMFEGENNAVNNRNQNTQNG